MVGMLKKGAKRNGRYPNILCSWLSALAMPPLEDFVEVIKALSVHPSLKEKANQKGKRQMVFNVETNQALTGCMKNYESCG